MALSRGGRIELARAEFLGVDCSEYESTYDAVDIGRSGLSADLQDLTILGHPDCPPRIGISVLAGEFYVARAHVEQVKIGARLGGETTGSGVRGELFDLAVEQLAVGDGLVSGVEANAGSLMGARWSIELPEEIGAFNITGVRTRPEFTLEQFDISDVHVRGTSEEPLTEDSDIEGISLLAGGPVTMSNVLVHAPVAIGIEARAPLLGISRALYGERIEVRARGSSGGGVTTTGIWIDGASGSLQQFLIAGWQVGLTVRLIEGQRIQAGVLTDNELGVSLDPESKGGPLEGLLFEGNTEDISE